MAVKPNTDEAFLREVDEELRRDQMVDVWTRYGRWILAAVVGGLVIFGGVLVWRYWSRTTAESQAVTLQAGYDQLAANKPDAAKAPFAELDQSGGPGYRALARMNEGNQLLKAGKAKDAAAKFAAVAGDDGVGRPLRDLALVRQTAIEFDTLNPKTVVDRLKPLAVKESAWLGSAGEMVALAYLKMGQPDRARDLFKLIGEGEDVPDTIRQRAVQMVDAVDVGAADAKGK